MTNDPLRAVPPDRAEELIECGLAPLRLDDREIGVRLVLRRADDGVWRGRLVFREPPFGFERHTAEIFCNASDRDLLESVQDLRPHHFRDLYRSLT